MRANSRCLRFKGLAAAIPLIALSGCGGGGGSAPGAVSEGEAQALEEAAEMLDDRRLPEGTLPPVGLPEDGAQPEQSEQAQSAEAVDE